MSNRLLFRDPVWLRSAAVPLAATRTPIRTAICAAWRRYRSRQRIASLDAHLLKDIGISYAEAEAEANKPFWRE